MILLGAIAGPALAYNTQDPFLIVPGEKIGLVKLPAQEEDFIKAYGNEAQPAEIGAEDGSIERATVLFPCDYKRLAVVFYDPKTRTAREIDAPPIYMVVMACAFREKKDPFPNHMDPLMKGQLPGDLHEGAFYTGTGEHAGKQPWWKSANVMITPKNQDDRVSAWHLPNGVRAGMAIADLQKLNGRPFLLSEPLGDGHGNVSDWRGGKLADCFSRIVWDEPADKSSDTIKTYLSSDPGVIDTRSGIDSLIVGASPGVEPAACKPDTTN